MSFDAHTLSIYLGVQMYLINILGFLIGNASLHTCKHLVKVLIFPFSCQQSSLFNWASSLGVQWYTFVVLICIFQILNKSNPFYCPLTMCLSSFMRCWSLYVISNIFLARSNCSFFWKLEEFLLRDFRPYNLGFLT